MDFKKTVAIHYTEFTPSERKICARILEDPQIVNNSIVVLGDLCETSKSAILRFYQKLGYRGYSEFKYSVEETFLCDVLKKTADIIKEDFPIYADFIYLHSKWLKNNNINCIFINNNIYYVC